MTAGTTYLSASNIESVEPQSVMPEPQLIELFRLRIANEPGGELAASKDGGATWQKLGCVLQYTDRTDPKGFTAAKWVQPVRVAATAVNAIHITTDYDPEADRAAVFSIIPKDIVQTGTSYYSASATIVTDIAPGTGPFGGGFAPLVGNSVWIQRESTTFRAEKGYMPARGDILIIIVEAFSKQPSQLVFDNREGGLIWLQFADGSRNAIGRVIRPVHGVGRFTGTRYAAPGRIRANHPGVIDVSCSLPGQVAGFQIIPETHAHSPEMKLALSKTQWMIVAPLSPENSWEGTAPLFYQYLRPAYRSDDLLAPDWQAQLLSRFLVEVQTGDGVWQPCPVLSLNDYLSGALPKWANSALENVTKVRILFPLSPRPPAALDATRN